jgi:hypothetical protein
MNLNQADEYYNAEMVIPYVTPYAPSKMLTFWSTRLPRAFSSDISTLVDVYDDEGVDYIYGLLVVGSSLMVAFLLWILNLFILTAVYRGLCCCCCCNKPNTTTTLTSTNVSGNNFDNNSNMTMNKKDEHARQQLDCYIKRLTRCRRGFLGTGLFLTCSLVVLLVGIVYVNQAFNTLKKNALTAQSQFVQANRASQQWLQKADLIRDLSHLNFDRFCPGAPPTIQSEYDNLHASVAVLLSEAGGAANSSTTRPNAAAAASPSDDDTSYATMTMSDVSQYTSGLTKITQQVSDGLNDVKAWFWSSIGVVAAFLLATLIVLVGVLKNKWDGWGLPERAAPHVNTNTFTTVINENQNDSTTSTPSLSNRRNEDGTIDNSPIACCGKTRNEHWKRLFSYVAVPSFVVLAWLNCIITSGFVIALTMNAGKKRTVPTNICVPRATVKQYILLLHFLCNKLNSCAFHFS